MLLKGGGEGVGEAGGVGVAVMDDRHVAQAEVGVGECGDRLGLVEIIGGGAVVAGMVVGAGVAAQVGGQRRGGVGGGDQHEAGFAEDGGCLDGRGRAGCADHADDARVADHRLGGRRAALRACRGSRDRLPCSPCGP